MTRPLALPAAPAITLSLQTWYDIETDWDYAYVSVSTDGATFTNLPSTITTNTNPNGQNFGNGITGNSAGWVTASFDLTPYAGQTVALRFRYWTDSRRPQSGIQFDALSIATTAARSSPTAPRPAPMAGRSAGFQQSHGTATPFTTTTTSPSSASTAPTTRRCETGPYNFGFATTPPRLRRALPLSGRPADPLLGHVEGRQQHQRACWGGADSADRRAPDTAPADSRHHRHAWRAGCRATTPPSASRPPSR